MIGLEALRAAVGAVIAQEDRDLSMRQLAVLLETHLHAEPRTVRGLSADLDVSRPAITRAVDALSLRGLVERGADPADRRSKLIKIRPAGQAMLKELGEALAGQKESQAA